LRDGLRPANELDRVTEFGLLAAIQLASSLLAVGEPARELVSIVEFDLYTALYCMAIGTVDVTFRTVTTRHVGMAPTMFSVYQIPSTLFCHAAEVCVAI